MQACSVDNSVANPGFGSSVGLKASVRESAFDSPFSVPDQLRARVDFWKDIFAKYGSTQTVIHHRDFPQIVFGVLDLSAESAQMSPIAFDAYKDSVEKRTVEDIKTQLLELANGAEPRTQFQGKLVELLKDVPGNENKYKRIVDEDLVRTQTGIRERYAEAIRRAWKYLPVMEQIFVSEYGLPKELTRIPFIESSFDYSAYSSVGAAGIWQFMPRTARAHRMLVGRYVDERRDPIKATRAAAEYLRSAYTSLGSWPLAITSYNHGVGGVRCKTRKAGTNDLATIIEDPNERYFGFASTNFYPEFLAALEIFADHNRYFPEVPEEPPLRVVTYPVRTSVSAHQIASRLGVSTEELKEANYALLDPVWKGRASIPAGYNLRVPADRKARGEKLLEETPVSSQVVSVAQTPPLPATYIVKRGEDVVTISKKFGIPASTILRINRLSTGKVKSGMNLQLIEDERHQSPSTPTSTARGSSSTGVRYTVRRGDTFGAICKKFGVSVEALKRANHLSGTSVKAGQILLVPR
jgi:membrane-bound lytic murein transglycosylase D